MHIDIADIKDLLEEALTCCAACERDNEHRRSDTVRSFERVIDEYEEQRRSGR